MEFTISNLKNYIENRLKDLRQTHRNEINLLNEKYKKLEDKVKQNEEYKLNTLNPIVKFNNDNIPDNPLNHLISDIVGSYLKIYNLITFLSDDIENNFISIEKIIKFCNYQSFNKYKINIFTLNNYYDNNNDIDNDIDDDIDDDINNIFPNRNFPTGINQFFSEDPTYLETINILNLLSEYRIFINKLEKNKTLKYFIFIDDNNNINVNSVLILTPQSGIKTYLFNVNFNNKKYSNDNFNIEAYQNFLNKIVNEIQNILSIPNDLNNLNDILNDLNAKDILSATLYEYGNPYSIETYKVIQSLSNHSWDYKLIKDCYIYNDDGVKMSIISIISKIYNNLYLNNYEGFSNKGDFSIELYNFNDNNYLGLCKICSYNGNICLLMNSINLNNIFNKNLIINGDIKINGSLDLYNNDNKLLSINNVNNNMTLNGQFKINNILSSSVSGTDINPVLDINNLSMDLLLYIIYNISTILMNSYDIINIISKIDLYNTDISSLFDDSGLLFDYKNQCQIFEIDLFGLNISNTPIDPNILELRHIRHIYNNTNITFNNESFLSRIKNIHIETSNLLPEFIKIYNTNNFMSYLELIRDDEYNWYIASIKGLIHYSEKNSPDYLTMKCVMTLYNITPIINDENIKLMTNIFNYFSLIHYYMNYFLLLVKDPDVFDNLLNNNQWYLIDKIKNNPHFYKKCGLSNNHYLFLFTNETNNQTCIFNERLSQYVGKKSVKLWYNDVCINDLNIEIYNKYEILFGKSTGCIFPIDYLWNYMRQLTFRTLFDMYGITYNLNFAIDIFILLNDSLSITGDVKIDGQFYVQNSENNVVFKIDNINNSITNKYNVGIGLDKPQSALHIKDTTIQNVIDFTNNKIKNLQNMNLILSLLNNSDESNFISIIKNNEIDNSNYLLYKIDMSSMLAKDITVIYDYEYPEFYGYKFENLSSNILYSNIMNIIKNIYQTILDNNILYNQILIIEIVKYINTTMDLLLYYFVNNGSSYFLINLIDIYEFNIKYETNKNLIKFFDVKKTLLYNLNELNRRINNITPIYNLNESLNTLSNLNAKYSNLINKFVIKIKIDTHEYSISDFNFDTFELFNTVNNYDLSFDELYKYNLFIYNLFKTPNLLNITNEYLIINYEDKNNDFLCICKYIKTENNIIEFVCYECIYSDILNYSLLVEGDVQINGDFIIKNYEKNNNYLVCDSINNFLGIGTDIRLIDYTFNYTTTNMNKYSHHNIHILNKSYPVIACNRIQEKAEHTADINNINPEYFGTYSSITAKRTSNLYTHREMYNYSLLLDEQKKAINPNDKISHFRYGSDISFEICDKNDKTQELGEIQMTIDNIDETGYIKAGFGVQVLDNSQDFSSSQRQILYVNNEGTLFINKIVLGGKVLAIDTEGNLTWDGKIIPM